MSIQRGDETAAGKAGRGHLRASHADREQVIGTLKAAFVQGMLAKDEFDLRVGQVLASRTYAELAAVTADLTADLPSGATVAQPRTPAQAQGWLTMKRAVTCSACMLIPTAIATAIGWVVAMRIDAMAAVVIPLLAFSLAIAVTGAMIVEVVEARDENKRSRARLPQGPAPAAGGQVSRRLPSAGPDTQVPPPGHGHQQAAEAAPVRRPRPRFSRWRPPVSLPTAR